LPLLKNSAFLLLYAYKESEQVYIQKAGGFMARIDEIKMLCDRLAPLGWRGLLQAATGNELDISRPTPEELIRELVKNLSVINRALPGFEDFAADGASAVTPAQPALSLLYHALASPLVIHDHEGRPLQGFPTPAELDQLENFIFSLSPLSLSQFVEETGGVSMVVMAVFSSEYRPASDTVDGRHADLVFSRTGIARVGTARPRYNSTLRGFWPEDEDNANGVRVLPARFTTWLAVKKKGRDARVSPILESTEGHAAEEPNRDFMIPVHKLFPGDDCVEGLHLEQNFTARLFNIKIQRIHKALGTDPLPEVFPYVIRDRDIADWSTDQDLGPGWLVPTLRPSLAEPAIVDGKPITFRVTAALVGGFAAVEPAGAGVLPRSSAPEYVHARTKVENGVFIDLNEELDVIGAMKKESYDALHYLDYSGEGWVEAHIPALADQNIPSVAAYALVCAPDFFPACGQFDVSEWSRSSEIPAQFRNRFWYRPPTPLSETRRPANVQLQDNPFSIDDYTITAVVGMGPPNGLPAVWPKQPDIIRASQLPDDAAGVFYPGWDVGADKVPGGGDDDWHLAAYALGSPFPEDAKLCAALSTFWPAVAPDVLRTFALPGYGGTVAPLTDEEIGQAGSLPWDGVPGPRVVTHNGERYVETASFLNADYVRQAVQNRFSLRLTAQISVEDYQARILAVSRAYSVAGNLSDIKAIRPNWLVLSFRVITSGDVELQQAQGEAHTILRGQIYRVELCQNPPLDRRENIGAHLSRFPLRDLRFFFTSPDSKAVLTKRETDLRWGSATSES
jgi:hypothetical protein